MKKLITASKWQALVLAVALVALGVAGLAVLQTSTAAPAAAASSVPGPLCGPTYQWVCVIPGCPTCPDVLFVGTICEKNLFEKQTGRVCSPI